MWHVAVHVINGRGRRKWSKLLSKLQKKGSTVSFVMRETGT
jgi:hypothetical protein